MSRFVYFFAVAASLVALACGGSSGGSGSGAAGLTPEPDAGELLVRAAAAAQALDSFHFRLDHENGDSPLPLNLRLVSAEGDIVVPGRLEAELIAVAGSINLSVSVISIDAKTWITNPFSRRWQDLPGASAGDFADPAALIAALLDEIEEVQFVGLAEVTGTETFRLRGTMDSAGLQVALPFAEAGMRVEIEIWIGVEDFLPRLAHIRGPLAAREAGNIARLLELSGFNAEIEIRPPQ